MSNHLQQTSADFDVELESNTSNNPTMQSLIEARLSRRQVVLGGAATASALAFSGLASAGPAKRTPMERPQKRWSHSIQYIGLNSSSVMLRLTLEQNLTSMMMVTLGFGLLIEGISGLVFGSGPQFV